MGRTIDELLRDARELAADAKDIERAKCGCLWKNNKLFAFCDNCAKKYPRYAKLLGR